jgi:TatD family hydrolase
MGSVRSKRLNDSQSICNPRNWQRGDLAIDVRAQLPGVAQTRVLRIRTHDRLSSQLLSASTKRHELLHNDRDFDAFRRASRACKCFVHRRSMRLSVPEAFLADRFPRPPGQSALRRRSRGDAHARYEAGVGRGAFHRHWRGPGRDAPGARSLPRVQRQTAQTAPALCERGHLSAQHHRDRRRGPGQARQLLAEPEVIACGEIGLDYYHEGAPHDVQRAGLIRQLEIAAARKRPILIHCRGNERWRPTDAWDDLFLVLEEHWRPTGLGGVMHCFGGGWEQARRSLDLGFLVSFAGNLTYPKAQPLRDVAAHCRSTVLVETDAPWLAPAPDRGKRNEPAFVVRRRRFWQAFWRCLAKKKSPPQPRKTFPAVSASRPDVGN